MFIIKKFKDEDFNIITIKKDGEVLFEAKSICKCLEYSKDTSEILKKKVDEDEKVLISRAFHTPTETGEWGKAPHKWFVTEAGLYTLIIKSRQKKAIKFRRWITHEVLPQIRKTGKYEIKKNEEKFDCKDLEAVKKEFIEALEIAKLNNLEGSNALNYATVLLEDFHGIELPKAMATYETTFVNIKGSGGSTGYGVTVS